MEITMMHKANGITRQQILSAIKLNGSMTADGLGKALGISPVAVRQHLAGLEAEGIIYTTVERKGLGRPVHRYSITAAGDETFPRNYEGLANTLLEELRNTLGDEVVDNLFARRRERMKAAMQIRLEGKPLPQKVAELAKIQAESGYMAEAEQTDGGFRFIEHNCAICQVARSYPNACEHELILLKELFEPEADVERETHIASGGYACTYRITPRQQ